MKYFFVFLTLLLASNLAVAKINETPAENEEPVKVKKALLEVQHQIKKLEKTVYHSHTQEKNLIKQLALLDKDIGEKSESLRQLQHKMAKRQQDLKNFQSEATALSRSNAAHQASLAELIQVTFQHYRKEKLQLLLEQHDLSTLARLNQYYQFFYQARANQINDLQNHLKRIQLVQDQIIQEQQQIQALTVKLKSEQESLQVTKEKRKEVLFELSQERLSNEEQLSQLQQQELHLEQLFKALEKKLSATPTYIEPAQDFAQMKHKLPFPIKDSLSKITVLPNFKKVHSKKSYIAATVGTPVSAIFAGKVVFAEWLRGIGLLLIVDHGNGYMSLYGNNQKLYKGIGDWVKQGEMIARVGQSGGHAEPGLYFEIRKGGEALDPTPWFQQG